MPADLPDAPRAVWFLNDKGALEAIDPSWTVPDGFGSELSAVLARPGGTAAELAAAVDRMEALAEAVAAKSREPDSRSRATRSEAEPSEGSAS